MKPAILRSNGELTARAYARVDVPVGGSAPACETARVLIVDSRRTETISGPPKRSGPRNPEQSIWPPPKAPGVELPDGRPLSKAQRIWIDPDLIDQWEREAAERKQGTG